MFQIPIYSVMYDMITTDVKPLWIPDTAGTALILCDSSRGQNVIFVCGAQFTHHDLNPPCKISTTIHHHTWYQIRSCERNLFVKSIWVSTHRHWHHHLVLCHFWRFKREYYTFFTFTSLVDLISSRNVYLRSLFSKNCIFMPYK